MTLKATPEAWQLADYWVVQGSYAAQCILELRDRIAALEAQRETEKACIQDIYEKLDRLKVQHESNWSRIVKLEDAGNHPAKPDSSPAPAGGLVERVADAIYRNGTGDGFREEARAAILAVAEWLGEEISAEWLREEVER
jgi:Txe/YoeB family toxin of Txe-Axe toxin-antitoxin module